MSQQRTLQVIFSAAEFERKQRKRGASVNNLHSLVVLVLIILPLLKAPD